MRQVVREAVLREVEATEGRAGRGNHVVGVGARWATAGTRSRSVSRRSNRRIGEPSYRPDIVEKPTTSRAGLRRERRR